MWRGSGQATRQPAVRQASGGGASLPPCGPGSSHRPRARYQPMQWRALRNTTKPPQGAASHGATCSGPAQAAGCRLSPLTGRNKTRSLLLHPIPLSASCWRSLLVLITRLVLSVSLLTHTPRLWLPRSQPARAHQLKHDTTVEENRIARPHCRGGIRSLCAFHGGIFRVFSIQRGCVGNGRLEECAGGMATVR